MSETTFVTVAAVLGPVWLAVIVVRTVLAEKAAVPGLPLRRTLRIRALDHAGIVLGTLLFLALIGRMIAALA
ncbi:hypothetical protein [Kutzneria chonburiensis]|uniref:DUF3017 domain-containing protein n=1 Tax=Kutzneria chonburiensis TaxID=1483604 RepID=A0ABV6N8Q3_9PSEU|nr:hypothetical protein [Kutzneria chonburiensis]